MNKFIKYLSMSVFLVGSVSLAQAKPHFVSNTQQYSCDMTGTAQQTADKKFNKHWKLEFTTTKPHYWNWLGAGYNKGLTLTRWDSVTDTVVTYGGTRVSENKSFMFQAPRRQVFDVNNGKFQYALVRTGVNQYNVTFTDNTGGNLKLVKGSTPVTFIGKCTKLKD